MGCGASKVVLPSPSSDFKVVPPKLVGAISVRLTNDAKGVSESTAVGSPQRQDTHSYERAATRHESHVSRAAVSLGWLQRFSDKHQFGQRGLTTAQVVTERILPATARQKCRFTDMMLHDSAQKAAVAQGRPYYFVSHTWGQPFAEMLAMVARHFEPEQQQVWRRQDGQPLPPLGPDEVFLWLDMFAVNQHLTSGQNAGDLAALWEAIHDAQETLMVLDPEGTVLTRIWCLYEAWQTSKSGPDKLRLLSYGIEFEQLEKVFIDLDVSRAQASVEADRIRILDEIQRDVGNLYSMTHRLKDALVAGTVAQVPPLEAEWTEDTANRLSTAALLCQVYGKLEEAEPLCKRALEGYERVLGPDHPDTLVFVNNFACLLESQGKYNEAEPLYRRSLAGSERALGPTHPDTLTSLDNLAGLLEVQGKHDLAEPLYRRALDCRSRVQGPSHPATLCTVNNMAVLLKRQGKYDKAEPLYRRALEGRERALGRSHPDTLTSVSNLAGLLESRGKYKEAEPLYMRALDGRERVLGLSHPDTLSAVSNLAVLQQSQGKYDKADLLHRRALEGRERVLGPDHPDTLTSVDNLAVLLECQGKYDAAEELYRRALEGRERVLGADHPDTITSLDHLLALLDGNG